MGKGFFGHPEVYCKPLLVILVFTLVYKQLWITGLHIFVGGLLWLLYSLLYAVKALFYLVLHVVLTVSDNLDNLAKQQPTNWLRDFTQTDSFDDSYLNWLTGFIEGDGSFPNSTRGNLTFYVTQSLHN